MLDFYRDRIEYYCYLTTQHPLCIINSIHKIVNFKQFEAGMT